MTAAWVLAWREIVRFLRQRNRVIGAVATPALFWFMIGSGIGEAFRPEGWAGEGYLRQFLPGAMLLAVLFTAIFSAISIIEDRNAGFLQGVLVSRAPRWAIVLGKVAGGACLAGLQGMLFLPLAWGVGFRPGPGTILGLAGFFLLGGAALTGLGYVLAWRMTSVQGFHAIMNLVLMPMWLLSGALFPVAAAAGWMGVVMRLNPAYYANAGMQRLLFGGEHAGVAALPSLAVCAGVLGGMALVCLAVGARITAESSPRNAA